MRCCILFVVAGALGCAGRQGKADRSPATGAGMPRAQSLRLLDSPRCNAPGPTIEMTAPMNKHGKPPHRSFTVDVSVRNPLGMPVWLLDDLGGGTLPTVVDGVTLSKSRPRPLAYVWTFTGDGGLRAVRVPPGTAGYEPCACLPAPTSRYTG